MSKTTVRTDSVTLANSIINGMQEKKAQRITKIDLREVDNSICDFFIICHGSSNTQIEGICRSIEEQTHKELNEKPWHIEGKNNGDWILLDYVNVVAHVFYEEARAFYDIESLWADVEVEEIEYQT